MSASIQSQNTIVHLVLRVYAYCRHDSAALY